MKLFYRCLWRLCWNASNLRIPARTRGRLYGLMNGVVGKAW